MIKGYERRSQKYQGLSTGISRAIRWLIWTKFIVIAIAIAQSLVFYELRHYLKGGIILLLLLVVYFYLDKKHYRLIGLKNTSDLLAVINSDGTKRLKGDWTEFLDNGSDLNPENHPYSSDLDIIGPESLFQWANMCTTPWGRTALADVLLVQKDDITAMKSRQEAVAELAPLVGFRHRMKAEGLKIDASAKEFRELLSWSAIIQPCFRKWPVAAFIRLLPFATLLLLVLGLVKIVPFFVPLLMVVMQGCLLFANRKYSMRLTSVHACSRSLSKLETLLAMIEQRRFNAPLLRALQGKMLNEQNQLPSKQIKRLAKLSSGISNRNHMFYSIIDLFLLWDLQLCISLEKWKYESGRHLQTWFEVLGKIESLFSLALIKYDHPDWAVASFEKPGSSIIINAVQVGHPLITRDCVLNDVRITREHPIVLVTGSNMSGKSTFLRTIGVNLVLAYAGAPVNARSFSCQVMSLFTCMRVADNLQKNISSFYAEILRVKMIIDQVKKDRVFFLLDELFKGTNSADRHTAASTIIQHLNQNGASGMVSTHDLELAVLEKESHGRILNYHFKESYHGSQISFDYKLRRGASDTRNAIFLIKASGIDAFD